MSVYIWYFLSVFAVGFGSCDGILAYSPQSKMMRVFHSTLCQQFAQLFFSLCSFTFPYKMRVQSPMLNIRRDTIPYRMPSYCMLYFRYLFVFIEWFFSFLLFCFWADIFRPQPTERRISPKMCLPCFVGTLWGYTTYIYGMYSWLCPLLCLCLISVSIEFRIVAEGIWMHIETKKQIFRQSVMLDCSGSKSIVMPCCATIAQLVICQR